MPNVLGTKLLLLLLRRRRRLLRLQRRQQRRRSVWRHSQRASLLQRKTTVQVFAICFGFFFAVLNKTVRFRISSAQHCTSDANHNNIIERNYDDGGGERQWSVHTQATIAAGAIRFANDVGDQSIGHGGHSVCNVDDDIVFCCSDGGGHCREIDQQPERNTNEYQSVDVKRLIGHHVSLVV
jgi:hypothetical protein